MRIFILNAEEVMAPRAMSNQPPPPHKTGLPRAADSNRITIRKSRLIQSLLGPKSPTASGTWWDFSLQTKSKPADIKREGHYGVGS